MIIQYSISQLQPGMYLTKICESWIKHPFWSTNFIIKNEDIALLKEHGITQVMIDLKKSVGIISNNLNAVSIQEATSVITHYTIVNHSIKKCSLSSEIKKAKKIVRQAAAKMQTLFMHARMGKALNESDALVLVEEINNSIARNSDALLSIVRLKNKDNYTYMHSVAVCALMISLSKTLGYDQEFCKKAGMAGLLHDIGKVFIPLDILNKPAKLTDEEFTVVKNHPMQGWELLNTCGNISIETLDVCLHHHERYDGTGYPHQLKGDTISIMSRMATVCDIYDAITSDRPYKKGWEPTVAIKNMSQWTGFFDPIVFRAFVSSIGIYPVGSIVKLTSGRIGVVFERCDTNLLTPKVKVFFSTKNNMRIVPEIVDLSKSHVKEKIESNEINIDLSFQNIADLLAEEN